MHEGKAQRAELFGHASARAISGATGRMQSLDIARGFAMVLVVFGHATIGAMGAGLSSDTLERVIAAIYAIHMPVFFFISGLLSTSLIGASPAQFASRLGARIVWPYLFWSLFLISAHFAMRNHTNADMQSFRPYTILWQPPAVMWFLYYLAAGLILARVLAGVRAGVRVAIAAVLVAASYALPFVPNEVRFIGFLLVGTVLTHISFKHPLPAWVVIASVSTGLLSVLGLISASLDIHGSYPASEIWLLPLAISAPVFVIEFSRNMALNMPNSTFLTALDLIGCNTMPIFVTHILITAGVRIALLRAGVDDWSMIIAMATVLGIALPLLAAHIAARLGMSKWLGWR